MLYLVKKHGDFTVSAAALLKPTICPECKKEEKLEVLKGKAIERWNGKYDYSKSKYINSHTKVEIICPEYGEFKLRPSVHLIGCLNKNLYKLYEILTLKFLNTEILYEVNKQIVSWLDKLRFDIYFPKYNIAIEYDGQLHFKPIERFGGEEKLKRTQELDKLKNELCTKNNCKLFRLPYNYKKEDINNLILSIESIIFKNPEHKKNNDNN